MYTELRQNITIGDYTLKVIYTRYEGFRYEVVKYHEKWYGKVAYREEVEALKAGKAKVNSLIKKNK